MAGRGYQQMGFPALLIGLVTFMVCLKEVRSEADPSSSAKVLQRVKRLDVSQPDALIRVKRLEDTDPESLERVKRAATFDESFSSFNGKVRPEDDVEEVTDETNRPARYGSAVGLKKEDEKQWLKVSLEGEFHPKSEDEEDIVTKRFDKHLMKIKRKWGQEMRKRKLHNEKLARKMTKQIHSQEKKAEKKAFNKLKKKRLQTRNKLNF